MGLPYFLLRLLPRWDYFCPKCKKPIAKNTHKCPHCGERFPFGFAIKAPPKVLKDPEALSAYVHEKVFPSLSEEHRWFLTQFFTTFFSDDFESGNFSAWSNGINLNGAGSSATVQSTTKYQGTYAAKFTLGAVAGAYAVAGHSLSSAYTTLFARTYVQVDALPTNDCIFALFAILDSAWAVHTVAMVINRNSGNLRWGLKYATNANATNYAYSGTQTISTGTWYCAQMKVIHANGAGEVRMWVNGVEMVTVTGLTNNNYTSQHPYLGAEHYAGSFAVNYYADAVVVADAYISALEIPEYDPVDQISNVDGVADVGTHSSFANMQAQDSVYDTLTEADVDAGTSTCGKTSGSGTSYRTVVANEFRGQVFTASATGEVQNVHFYGRG